MKADFGLILDLGFEISLSIVNAIIQKMLMNIK